MRKSNGNWRHGFQNNLVVAVDKLPEDFDRMGADCEKFREYLISRHK
jgi:hypothetical protein